MEKFVAGWAELAGAAGWNAERAARVGDDLYRRHCEPIRHYHSVEHVEAVLAHLKTLDAATPTAVTAAYFHDAVYDPQRSDNEIASAQLARRELTQLGAEPTLIEATEAIVEATAGHQLPAQAPPDTAAFLDADLAILAADPAIYDAYTHAIRAEYAHLDEATFHQGRHQVLAGFLERPRLYFTATGHDRWEAAARANLARELADFGG